MSNDYTQILPPVPHNPHTALERDWTQAERKVISAYGHAVAAPLLSRIAELEQQRDALVEALKKARETYASQNGLLLRIGEPSARALLSEMDAALRAAGVEL